jgi:membrane protease YdiL (CAAX protease family)
MNQSKLLPIEPAPTRSPDPILIPLAFLAGALIELGVGSVLGNDPAPAWLLGRRLIALPISVAAYLWLGERFGMPTRTSLGLTTTNLKRYWWRGLIFGLVLAPFVLGIHQLIREVFPSTKIHPAFELLESGGWPGALSAIATAVILAPVAEEILYRGIIMLSLTEWIGRAWGLALSSILFGAVHYTVWPAPIPLALLGYLFALSFVWTRSLWMPIFAHAGFNGVNMLLWFAMPSSS